MADRPGIYLHVEFGVAWPPRKAPRRGELTYMSKSFRRQPAKATCQRVSTDAEAIPHSSQHHEHTDQPSQDLPHHTQVNRVTNDQVRHPPISTWQQPYYYYYASRDYSQRRHSRPLHHSQTLSSWQRGEAITSDNVPERTPGFERGHSAPPLGSDDPWNDEPEPMTATALPRKLANSPAQLQQSALPAGQYRLGADGMPWSPSPFPQGSADSDTTSIVTNPPAGDDHNPAVASADMPQTIAQVSDERQRCQVTEIQSLASALMTVDNGFEDQWWYQGDRYLNIAGDLISPADLRESLNGRLGWAVANANNPWPVGLTSGWHGSHASYPSVLGYVSPINDSVSPLSEAHPLGRSQTTRSNEMRVSI